MTLPIRTMSLETRYDGSCPSDLDSVPTVEPLMPFDVVSEENSGESLVHPENLVMLDGIWKKRFRSPFMARLMILIAQFGYALRSKQQRLLTRD